MNRWLIAAAAALALAACDRSAPTVTADLVPTDAAIYIVNFDETQTTLAAVTNGILTAGAGVVQFNNFSMVAALATPAQLLTISALPGLEGIYANKQLDYYMLHESVPAIRPDAGDVLFIFWALAGFDYILDHQRQYNIKVVNNSWGTTGAFDPKDPINEATKKVTSRGITVVFAAGNDGPAQNTLNPYSVAPWVISVAAGCKVGVTDPTNSEAHCMLDDGSNALVPTNNEPRAHVLGDFSSRGVPGDNLYHPDITAPGVHIVSTRASTGTVLNGDDANHDVRICQISATNLAFYTCASGTSMASPHIAGVVALMQEAAGGKLSPTQVLNALTSTAQPLPGYATWEVGAGFVDAYAAVMKVRK